MIGSLVVDGDVLDTDLIPYHRYVLIYEQITNEIRLYKTACESITGFTFPNYKVIKQFGDVVDNPQDGVSVFFDYHDLGDPGYNFFDILLTATI